MNQQAALLAEAMRQQAAGDLAAVAASYRCMLNAEPDNTGLMVELGRTEQALGQAGAAAVHYQAAIARDAACFDAWCNLGALQLGAGDYSEAIDSLNRAAAIDPASALPPLNLGMALHETGDLDAAIAAYRRAVTLAPDMSQAHFNLANGLGDAHLHVEAVAVYQAALRLDPGYVQARWNMALSLLMLGNYQRGWPAYEARWLTGHLNHEARSFEQPQWRGEDIAGKTLLLWSEQGFGDSIQFCRYATLAAARGARVILATRPQLRALLGSLAGVAEVIDLDAAPAAFDWHCPLMSLPLAFATTLDSIPATTPYLKAPASLISDFKVRVKAGTRMRVGLVWSAGARPQDTSLSVEGASRSLPAALLATLDLPGIEFFSLQVDVPASESPLKLIDLSADLKTFADTAAMMTNLDLVITVDTAAAHLAGALGRPVWLLLSDTASWRWGRDIATCPWYPTMRVFRQGNVGDWRAPLAAVRTALGPLAREFTRQRQANTGLRARLAQAFRRAAR